MRFVFAGNRFFVLEEMLRQNLKLQKIFAVKNSYLEKELVIRKIDYEQLETKKQLIQYLMNCDFDIFLSNGCPYIIPVNEILKSNSKKRLINIHPSYLPDLRGADPQPGAILFGRDSGATCHEMDDGIDSGKIISQVKIPFSDDLDVRLLYQLTFKAEKEAFKLALDQRFIPRIEQEKKNGLIYYTYKEEDRIFSLDDELEIVKRKIKAFSNKSKGAYFMIDDKKVFVWAISLIKNPYVNKYALDIVNKTIMYLYEDIMVIKNWDKVFSIRYSNPDNIKILNDMVL